MRRETALAILVLFLATSGVSPAVAQVSPSPGSQAASVDQAARGADDAATAESIPSSETQRGWIETLVARAPWIVDVLVLIVGIAVLLLLWGVLAFPASLIRPVVTNARAGTKELVDGQAESRRAAVAGLRPALTASLGPFMESHRFREIVERSRATWLRGLEILVKPIDELRSKIDKAGSMVTASTTRLERISENLKTLPRETPPMPTLSDGEEAGEEVASLLRARVNVMLSSVLIVALITVNTGMLSQILSEIGLDIQIPGTDIRLNLVLALILTLIEAGIGVVHGYVSWRAEDEDQTTLVSQVVLVSMAGLLAVMEGTFYSRVGDASDTFSLPFTTYQMDMTQAFFVLGLALPIVLFLLGQMFFRSLTELVAGNPFRALNDYLRRMRKRIEGMRHQADKASQALREADAANEAATQSIPHYSDAAATRTESALEAVRRKLEELRDQPPSWVRDRVEWLEESELWQEAVRAAALAATLLILLALSTWIHGHALAEMYPDLSWQLQVCLALLRAAVLVTAGALLRGRSLALADGELYKPEARASHWAGIAFGAAAAAAILLFDLSTIYETSDDTWLLLLWCLILASDVALLALGREIASMLAITLVGLLLLVPLLRVALIALVWVLGLLFIAVLAAVEFVLKFLAAPVDWLRNRRSRTAP